MEPLLPLGWAWGLACLGPALGCVWALGCACPGGAGHGHISHIPLLGKGRGGGGGGLAHLPSFLFSDREGLEISSIHTPSSSEKGNCVNGQVSCSPFDKGDWW